MACEYLAWRAITAAAHRKVWRWEKIPVPDVIVSRPPWVRSVVSGASHSATQSMTCRKLLKLWSLSKAPRFHRPPEPR